MSYAALFAKTNFSFLEGASHPGELVEEAHRFGLDALAITDRDSVAGIVRAHVKARELGVKLLIGSQVTVDGDSEIVLLAQTREGYANLCALVTRGRLRSPKGHSSVAWSEVCAHARGLIALCGGARSPMTSPMTSHGACDGAGEERHERGGSAVIGELAEAFGDRLYALCLRHRRAEDVELEARLRERAARHRVPIAAAVEVLYHDAGRRRLQDVLTCVRHGVTLSSAGKVLNPNAEHALKSGPEFAALFADDPGAALRTREIAARCSFSLCDLRYRYPAERLPDGTSSSERLRWLAMEGARGRYGGRVPEAVRAQLERELEVVNALDYCGYFLTMHEIVEFCAARNILCQGRGSAANSALCYCLRITAIDPVQMGLLFERFLSRERAEPPDIDLDIEHERREEVIQHVYERYGRAHAAMVANVIRYRARSALRDVGKALDVPESALLRLSKLHSRWDGIDERNVERSGLQRESDRVRLLLELAQELEDFPRHLSIHPGGFLLGHEPVSMLVPIENATMERRTVIQWDKYDVEALGLFKVDLLGLGALTHLHRTFDLVREHRARELSLATVPPDDPETFDMICRGDTVGVFQIESRAQMAMLPRLKPKSYYDLVIEVSIVRPGPITGGMVHPYLRRRSGREKVVYPHECLRSVLEKTLGVPLFQEQVMRLAVVAADYTPGEADQLRRDMAAWQKSGRIEAHRERLVTRMQKKGIAPEFAERVFQQICGFGEYGFPESHAASFALISYAGAWLRRHYPEEFTCALLNAQPMGFYSIATIVEDARRHGILVRPVDVRSSRWDAAMESSGGRWAVRMGLRFVKGMSRGEGDSVEAARAEAEFASMDDFARRAGVGARALKALAAAGAFEGLEPERRSALWSAIGAGRARPAPLFDGGRSEPGSAAEEDGDDGARFLPLGELETIRWDHGAMNHSTRGHLLGPLRAELRRRNLPDARGVSAMGNGQRVRYAGIVICRQRPATASGITFMTLEDETGFVNVVIHAKVLERFAPLVKTVGFLGVTGRLQVEEEVVHVIAERFWKPRVDVDLPDVQSRDFH